MLLKSNSDRATDMKLFVTTINVLKGIEIKLPVSYAIVPAIALTNSITIKSDSAIIFLFIIFFAISFKFCPLAFLFYALSLWQQRTLL